MISSAESLMGLFYAKANLCGVVSLNDLALSDAALFNLPTVTTSAGEVLDHCSITQGLQDLRARKLIRQTHDGVVTVRFPEMGQSNG